MSRLSVPFVLAAMVLTVAHATSAQAGWSAPQRLSQFGGHAQIAVEPQGLALAAWGETTVHAQGAEPDTRRIQAAGRAPGGEFGTAHTLSDGNNGEELDVALAPTGDAVVVWVGPGGVHARVRPAGAIFGAENAIGPGGRKPHVAIDGQGNAVAVWESGNGIEAAFRPAGGDFGAPGTLGEGTNPQVAVDRAGNALAAWESNGEIAAADRPVGGAFGAAFFVSGGDEGNSPQVSVGATGDAAIAWVGPPDGIKVATRPNGGGFTAPVVVGGGVAAQPRVAVDGQGRATVIWTSELGELDHRIQTATGAIGGGFGPVADLSRAGNQLPEPQLEVVANPAGATLAIWKYQSTSESEPGRGVRIDAAMREPGGAFDPPDRLSDNPCVGASSPQAGIDDQGNAVAIWHSNKGVFASSRAAGSGPGSGADPTCPTGGPAEDSAEEPCATVTVPRQRLGSVLRRGLRVLVKSLLACRLTVDVRLDAASARRMKLRGAVGHATGEVRAAATAKGVVRIRKRIAKRLKGARTLGFVIATKTTDNLGGVTRRTTKVAVRR